MDSAPPNPQVHEFFDKIAPFHTLWPYATIRYLAYVSGDVWYDGVSTIVLGERAMGTATRPLERRAGPFRFGTRTVRVLNLVDVARSLDQDILPGIEPRICLKSPNQTELPKGREHDYAVTWWNHAPEHGQFSAVTLGSFEPKRFELQGRWQVSGTSRDGEAWRRLDDLLKSCPEPYLSLKDLTQSFIGFKQDFNFFGGGQCIIVAPLPGRIDQELNWMQNPLSVKATLPPRTKTKDYQLAAVMERQGAVVRSLHQLSIVRKGDGRGRKVMRARVDTSEGMRVTLVLMYQGFEVDRLETWLPAALRKNPRIVGLTFLDRDLEQVTGILENPKGFLESRRKEAHRETIFEEAVGWLLGICGFQTIHAGSREYQLNTEEEIDWLGFAPNTRQVLSVEVTTAGVQQQGKLGKLRNRTDALQRVLDDHDILPVLVTSEPNLHQDDKEKADGLGIVIATPKTLSDILSWAAEGDSPNEIFEELAKYLPKRNTLIEQ